MPAEKTLRSQKKRAINNKITRTYTRSRLKIASESIESEANVKSAIWRFVLPSEYNGLIKWGIIIPGTYNVDENVLRPIENGPTQLIDGPNVIWFGGHKPLSINLAAIIILKVPPPHYIAFGSSENQNDPPKSLEIISFDDDKLHPPHK